MELPPNATAHFAEQHIKDAQNLVAKIEENRFIEVREDRLLYQRFYNSLAPFSGGTIALSVTYLGYLKTLTHPVLNKFLLTGSWILLLLCLTLSLFFLFFNAHYGHYYREREYLEALAKKFETEAKEIHKMNIINLRTPPELDAYVRPRLEAASRTIKNAKWNAARERIYLRLWIWTGVLARTSFVVGLVLLAAFAISNN